MPKGIIAHKPFHSNINLTGLKYGRYTVMGEGAPIIRPDGQRRRTWVCRCDCGTIKTVVQSTLVARGDNQSCGCLNRELSGIRSTKHGKCHASIYQVWNGMKERCLNPKHSGYMRYGGRGITVCNEWLVFENFFRDMGAAYRKGLSIDRIDNNGPYCKENCKWATRHEQARNKRTNRWVTIGDTTMVIADWAIVYGISEGAIYHRISDGWDPVLAVRTPVKCKR